MKKVSRWLGIACSAVVLAPLTPAFAGPLQPSTSAAPTAQALPAGEGKDLLQKNCVGCHQLGVITSQQKTESGWTDTIVEMRNRGANGTDEEMEKIIHYLAANFSPQQPGSNKGARSPSAPASAAAASSTGSMTLPPKKPQPTPQKVIDEHVAALNSCDWNRLMAQYDDGMAFLSKDGEVVQGREAIGEMFKKMVQPHSAGGMCGVKLIPEKTFIIGDTVNVAWRVEAPFLTEPYRGSEAFETRNGLLVLQVTTWDPSAMKMKQ